LQTQFQDTSKGMYRAGLHNSESSRGQIININWPRATKVCFILIYRFCCSMEEILEQQLFEVELFNIFYNWESSHGPPGKVVQTGVCCAGLV